MAYSGQDAIAYQTGYQDGIFGRTEDNPYNINTVPKSYRAYSEGYADGTGSTTPPRGPQGPAGTDGADSSVPGPPGDSGIDGADGLAFLQGAGAPAGGLGSLGDTYWDNTTSGDIYEKTGVSTWTFTGRIGEVTLAIRLDDIGGAPNILYKGDATAGSLTSATVWRMQRITIASDGDVTIEWADGNTAFDNIYDNRAALSYS